MQISRCDSLSEQVQLIEKLEIFKIQGRDKRGRQILRVIGKFLPVRVLSSEALMKYLEEKIFPSLGERPFSVVLNQGESRGSLFRPPGPTSQTLSGHFWTVLVQRRVGVLWEHVRRNGIEIPEFVYDHDEELEYRPMMDYGLESDHPRVYAAPAMDSPVSTYSMRCIS
ncbi:hypothetical protein IFM89_027613 [Coptis chinensis]|uniref:CRAL-TRIO domain-containing protein n=1 Tax=Coptis chinensis TaxID=261450 RepID=A0A835MC87_9MAGN|nr:hypothetical protein IFM89_027613 [Coptis chinensis]